MDFKFKFPKKSQGYFQIKNFPYWYKDANNETITGIEFAHFITEIKSGFKNKKNLSFFCLETNIKNLMFLKIGEVFDLNSKRVFNKSYQQLINIESYKNIKLYTSNVGDSIFSTDNSVGTNYYLIETRSRDLSLLKVIIPSIVIGQAFFLVNSILIENLFKSNFQEITELISWDTVVINNLLVGRVFLKKNSSPELISLAKTFSFFLFSKDNYLYVNLCKMQSFIYRSVVANIPRNSYKFLIPIDEKLKLKINGHYHNSDECTYFVANEIITVDHESNFSDLYIPDYITFINETKQQNIVEKLRKSTTGRRTKPIGTKKKVITNDGVNKDVNETFLTSANNILGAIVNISVQNKLDKNAKNSLNSIFKDSGFGTFSKIPDPNSKSGGLSGGKDGAKSNFDLQDIFQMLHSLVDKLKTRFNLTEHNNNNEKICIFHLANSNNQYVLLISDCYSDRIQIVHKATLQKMSDTEVNNYMLIIDNLNYNWRKIKNNKENGGILIQKSTNFNFYGTRSENKSKKNGVNAEEVRISDLCYLNILEKLENLFVESN